MRTTLNRLAAGVAAAAVASLAVLAGSASALPPGTAAAGTSVISPATGTNANNFNLTPPSGAACPGDSASGGYRWSTFFVASSVDPATLTYASGLPVQQGSAYTDVLYNSTGSAQASKTTAPTTGLITPIPLFSFSANALPAPNGTYNIGYACTLSGATMKFWSTPITISNSTATTFSYSFGAAPVAPVLGGTLVAGDQTLDGTFTHAASIPATTGYTVTAVPSAGATVTLPVAAGATTFSLTGLVNGTSYSVSVVATNTAGISLASNTVNGTPSPAARAAVTNLLATPGINNAALSWTAPVGVAPIGYSVTVTPSVPGSPFAVAAGATSLTVAVPAAACGITSFSFAVMPIHGTPFVGTSASTSAVANCDGTVIQNITVVRPAGALVLTQRCGVNGPLAIEPASPGFGVLPAIAASGNQVGTAPTLTVGGAPDPQFANYPNPSPVAPATHCGVNLGTAQLVQSGTLAGQYYTASGFINQVTVSDTRDTDSGWTVNGTMSAFTVAGGGSSFSGNLLGWTPVVTNTSGVLTGGYDQTVTAGPNVLPDTPAGLATPKVLAFTPVLTTVTPNAPQGLGIASFDARLKLLIPVSARAGTYTGTLTFTVA